jgi:predicted nuclease of restriction endonuclease-like (RecB) superfamily
MTKGLVPKKVPVAPTRTGGYERLLGQIIEEVNQARHLSARVVNAAMTATYWLVGRHIVEFEQAGAQRAEYGEALLKKMAADLTARVGKGFSLTNLKQFRQFYLTFPQSEMGQTASDPLRGAVNEIGQTVSGLSSIRSVGARFPLPWSAYVRLLSLKDETARCFYEAEALRSGWSVRQLDRQIQSLFYERTALSKNKAALLTKAAKALPQDAVQPEEEIKDPYVLEFLGLKDEYSESDIEAALIEHLERFLLELGGDFAFMGRQRRLRVGDEWYRVDLLFFHRRLKCLVVIDLKTGKFTHADAGQMHLYLNYAREHWMREGENPPVGLILCAQKDEAVAKYALEGLSNKVLAAEYRMVLPEEKVIVRELEETRKMLEGRKVQSKNGKRETHGKR